MTLLSEQSRSPVNSLTIPTKLTHQPCRECQAVLPADWGNSSKMAFYCGRLVDDVDDRREKMSFWSDVLIAISKHQSHQSSPSKLTFTANELQKACRYDGDEPTSETMSATIASLVAAGTFAPAQFGDIAKVRTLRTSSVSVKPESSSFSLSTFATPTKLFSVTAQAAWSASKFAVRSAGKSVVRSLWSTSDSTNQSAKTRYVNLHVLNGLSNHLLDQISNRGSSLSSSVLRLDELIHLTNDLSDDDRNILLAYMSSKSWLVEILTPEDQNTLTQTRAFKISKHLTTVEPLEYDRAIIAHVLELTEARIVHVHEQMVKYSNKAKLELARGSRDAAKRAIAQKKSLEPTRGSLQAQASNLHHIIDTMDQAHEQQQMITCMTNAQRTLSAFQRLNRVEDVEELMEQLRDTTDDINEVDELLSQPVIDVNVDDEMEEMMRSMSLSPAASKSPSISSTVPAPSVSIAQPSVAHPVRVDLLALSQPISRSERKEVIHN